MWIKKKWKLLFTYSLYRFSFMNMFFVYVLCAYYNNKNEIKLYLLPFFETSTWSFKIVEPAFKIYFPFLIQCIIVTDVYFKQFILINSFKEDVLHYDLIDLLTFTRTSRILCIYKNPKFDMYNCSKTWTFYKIGNKS